MSVLIGEMPQNIINKQSADNRPISNKGLRPLNYGSFHRIQKEQEYPLISSNSKKMNQQQESSQFLEGITLNQLYGVNFKAISCDQKLIRVNDFEENANIQEVPLNEELASDSEEDSLENDTIRNQRNQLKKNSMVNLENSNAISYSLMYQNQNDQFTDKKLLQFLEYHSGNDSTCRKTNKQNKYSLLSENNSIYNTTFTKLHSLQKQNNNKFGNQSTGSYSNNIKAFDFSPIEKNVPKQLPQAKVFYMTGKQFHINKSQSPVVSKTNDNENNLNTKKIKIININSKNISDQYMDPRSIEGHIAFRNRK